MKDDKSTSDDQIKEVENGNVVTPKGFQAAGIYSGVKRSRKDLGAIYSTTPANAAAVYTLNQIQAAPLHVTKESIAEDGKIQAVIDNSGNANACTGKQGEKEALTMRREVAEQMTVKEEYVAVASTGIIGLDMPMDKISSHITKLDLGETTTHADAFNEAILTTDTFKKRLVLKRRSVEKQ